MRLRTRTASLDLQTAQDLSSSLAEAWDSGLLTEESPHRELRSPDSGTPNPGIW